MSRWVRTLPSAVPGGPLSAQPFSGSAWQLWRVHATKDAAIMTKEEDRAHMLARHDLVVSIMDLNSRQLRCTTARAGLDIERACAVRDAALPNAPATAAERIEMLDRRMADLESESVKLAKQREFIEATLRALDGNEPAAGADPVGHA